MEKFKKSMRAYYVGASGTDNIFDEDWEEGIPAILRRIAGLEDEVKKLKRHKHDERTGDVMIRI